MAFGNRILRGRFGRKRGEVPGGGGGDNYAVRSFIICSPQNTLTE
jgi:hypothetical protein